MSCIRAEQPAETPPLRYLEKSAPAASARSKLASHLEECFAEAAKVVYVAHEPNEVLEISVVAGEQPDAFRGLLGEAFRIVINQTLTSDVNRILFQVLESESFVQIDESNYQHVFGEQLFQIKLAITRTSVERKVPDTDTGKLRVP